VLAALLAAAAVLLFMSGSPERRLTWLGVKPNAAGGPGASRLPRFGVRARQRRSSEQARVIEAIAALAAELRAGQPPGSALQNAAGSPPVWPSALAALRLDGDVPEALRVDAVHHPVLRSLAACWEVGSASGTGLAAAVNRLAEAGRAAEEVRGELEVQLAGPRATARTLATLPLIGLLLGILMGADPVSWLLGSTLGLACLASGVALTGLGILWTGRIAAGVERQL
jgi:tight adherence protein B